VTNGKAIELDDDEAFQLIVSVAEGDLDAVQIAERPRIHSVRPSTTGSYHLRDQEHPQPGPSSQVSSGLA
jgi:hypothetical protein